MHQHLVRRLGIVPARFCSLRRRLRLLPLQFPLSSCLLCFAAAAAAVAAVAAVHSGSGASVDPVVAAPKVALQ